MLLFGSRGAWQDSGRLSAAAHRAVQRAERAAAARGLDAATPDLLLLALVSDEDGMPRRALRGHGLDIAALRRAIGGPEPGSDLLDERRAPLDDAARESVVLGVNEARRGGFEQAGAGHLLLGVVETRSGRGARMIERSGVRLADLRATVDALERSAPLDADDAATFERTLTALLERVGGAQQCACCGATLHATFAFCYRCGTCVTD